jgi:hypothetical protein
MYNEICGKKENSLSVRFLIEERFKQFLYFLATLVLTIARALSIILLMNEFNAIVIPHLQMWFQEAFEQVRSWGEPTS